MDKPAVLLILIISVFIIENCVDCKHKAIKDDVDRLIDELEGLQAREENLETPSIEEVDDAELLQTGRDTLETDENKHGRRYFGCWWCFYVRKITGWRKSKPKKTSSSVPY